MNIPTQGIDATEPSAPRRHPVLLVLGAMLCILGCSAAYYGTMEKLGIEKRELLRDRVEDAERAQADAKDQFQDALEQFRRVLGFDGGELETVYDQLKREFEASQERAKAVEKRIDDVQTVAEDLFAEWQQELDDYEDPRLRRRSEEALRKTRQRYERLYRTMQSAELSMAPVLEALEDQVLYLKHNLNAQAIGSLADTSAALSSDVDVLVQRMEAAIREARDFAQTLKP